MSNAALDEELEFGFSVPAEGLTHPRAIATKLMELPEHKHLIENNIRVEYLFRHDVKMSGGKMVLGSVHEPSCQGAMRPLFEWLIDRLFGYLPDYLMILDKGFWDSVTGNTREALIHHELMHIQQKRDEYGEPRFNRITGEALYGLAAHDIEEFNLTAQRYGAWSPAISDFMDSVK